ncbi:fasciclin domain-containing protein [Gemmatimonas sp.]|uniref:fasciclin domain-containing protein n=1 Tax=Gemmatimonas sp. TaxID=1962908 RepID=UPI0037BF7976
MTTMLHALKHVSRRAAAALSFAALTTTMVACGDDDNTPVAPATQTIVQTAAGTPQLSTLVSALQAAELTTTLSGAGPFTVFAPVNPAFSALPADVLTRLLETGNRAILTKVLTFHVVPGRITASQLQNGQTLTTVEGTTLPVTVANGVVTVGGARVTTADINASNGVVHLIDGVMLGSLDIVDNAIIRGFSSLVSAVTTANLTSALRGGNLTVFAPTNAAFAAIPGGAPTTAAALAPVLQLHVVGSRALSSQLTNGQQLPTLLTGANLTVALAAGRVNITGPRNTVQVVTADIVAKNGVIHVVDNVLLPAAPPQTITQTAVATAQLSTLVTALQAAELTGTLSGAGPFTVFAPVNDAFAALPAGVVSRLLETGNRAILSKLLTFHVVPGRITASQLQNGQTLTTVEGTTLPVTVANGVVTVGGARVTTADINASNGVVHLIDGVLLGSLDIVDNAIIRGFSSLVSAVTAANLGTALRGGNLTVFAPTNAAFAAIPGGAPSDVAALTRVLQLHVVGARALSTQLSNGQQLTSLLPGGTLTVSLANGGVRIAGPLNSASVVTADIVAKNGVIHVIDNVLLPAPALGTITQTAVATAQLSTLVAALQAAELTGTLSGTGPFTVFAPVNAAFADLPAGVLQRLLETGNRAILSKLLTFHVVPGRITASQLRNGQTLTTVEGTTLPVVVASGFVFVGGARVTTADIEASNGVVHLIDGVLLGSLDIVDNAIIRGLTSLVGAVTAANLTTALRGENLTVFAPTNAAFAAIPGGAPTNPATLASVLQLHVVGSRLTAAELSSGRRLNTLLPNTGLTVELFARTVRLNGPRNFATVVAADIVAKNGIIHLIDTVLLP